MAKITMLEAITRAHAWEMSHDPSVVVLGEDVGVNGGVFRATAGLQEQFGKDRVQDTPLAEGMESSEQLRHRRGDRCNSRRTRTLRSARPNQASDRI
jgi:hypothetical protein